MNIDKDIDKDIEIVRDLGNEYYVVDKNRTKISFKESQAIENVLEDLETWKKIAEKLAEVVDFDKMNFNCSPMCIHDNCITECVLGWAKREVEKDAS